MAEGPALTDRPQDQTQAYEGVHRELFEVFLELADDGVAQTRALLELAPWEGVRSLLSVGGGEGLVEAELLRHAPDAGIWYLDPSPEQAAAFRAHLDAGGLSSRISVSARSRGISWRIMRSGPDRRPGLVASKFAESGLPTPVRLSG